MKLSPTRGLRRSTHNGTRSPPTGWDTTAAPATLPAMMPRGRRGRRPPVFLLLTLLREVMRGDRPVVTVGLVALCVALHLQGPHPTLSIPANCLSADAVLRRGQLHRLLASALLHVDDLHLYYNMVSLLWKGRMLEPVFGPGHFLALCCALMLATSIIHVYMVQIAWAALAGAPLARHFDPSACAVGISGLLFALKVLAGDRRINPSASEWSSAPYLGFRVPTRHLAWAELLIIQFVAPNVSFVGHLSGILAGLLVRPLLLNRRIGWEGLRRAAGWFVGAPAPPRFSEAGRPSHGPRPAGPSGPPRGRIPESSRLLASQRAR
ncbi:unnamed protein product [Ostreobium quekettii]|uniref:Peptidase S54 rhomboid domain-containing protein n=1 Tax=Ostreobium quekettii TaxID=121088 RepID=A0A8S1ITI4_9CHLO|nr:unnamed protein product [Ostreobium quekettii]|eukprot:evm.model.scf_191.9 EVM.evm.TU.scf_191.9   scf_191:62069-63034(-)